VKLKVLVTAGVVVVIGIVVAALLLPSRKPQWTTSSPEALSEFQKGLDSSGKLYYGEAARHFQRAVELDPGFVAAQRFLLSSMLSMDRPSTDPEVERLVADLRNADLSKLNARERFLVSYTLAVQDKDPAKAQTILQDYAAKDPNDPFALEILANRAADQQDWPETRRLLTHLIEVAPNRVVAYNQLGYLEMGLGQFAQAEKMFETYRYIAPDQANPRDSLGELYVLIGRYGEARRQLDEALRIRPDFCASYEHLARLDMMEGRPDDARAALVRAEKTEACPSFTIKSLNCWVAAWEPLLANDWRGVWSAETTACADEKDAYPVLKLWAALKTGRTADAEAIVAKAREDVAKMQVAPSRRYADAVLAHMEGALLLAQGKAAEAAERFRFADEGISYRELRSGTFKLLNRCALAQALQASGSTEAAAAVLAEARAVNPTLVDRMQGFAAPSPAS
jgi:tetratricopeptide (TPR) repeat protein